ncbi:replication protein [Sporosarcina sp. USHLN248]|uniref:replication protein n=1 Tax=Sporosarcina sp. USHLN248 TaxID=3081300 RepID=UPI003018A004
MSGVQTENGFTKIANELLEQIATFKFNGSEFRIIMTIWRFTYGFNRKSHPLSTSFIAEAVGIENSRVRKVLKKLIDNNVIHVLEEATFNESRVLAFNKNYASWKVEKDWRGEETPHCDKNAQPEGANKTQPQGSERTQPQGSNTTPKKETLKDNLKENVKDNNSKPVVVVDDEFAKLSTFYAENIGPLNAAIGDELSAMCDMINPELALLALKESVLANANNKIRYTYSILKSWQSQRFQTAADVERAEARKRNHAQMSNGKVRSLFDPSPETLKRQQEQIEKYRGKEIDMSGLPY